MDDSGVDDSATANEWDRYAAGWDDDPAVRAYADAAFASLTALLAEAELSLDGARVIDFGCGTGRLTEHLLAAGAAVHAIDTSPAMLRVLSDKADRWGWKDLHCSDSLPERGAGFDLVACASVCAFLDDYPGTVAELASRLGPGGMFVQWDWERTGGDDHGLARTEIHEALTAAGLADVSVGTAFTVEVEGQAMSPLMGHGRSQGLPHS